MFVLGPLIISFLPSFVVFFMALYSLSLKSGRISLVVDAKGEDGFDEE